MRHTPTTLMGKHVTGKWGRGVKERGQRGFRANYSYAAGQRLSKEAKQMWCYVCSEPHEYHPPHTIRVDE